MTSFDNLNEILEKQKKAHLTEGPLSVETRKEWIDRCIALLIKYQNEIAEAISEDFGHRSTESSLLADVAGSIGSLKSAKENIKKMGKARKKKSYTIYTRAFRCKTKTGVPAIRYCRCNKSMEFPRNLNLWATG